MKAALLAAAAVGVLASAVSLSAAWASPGPQPLPPTPAVAPPRDVPFPGVMNLAVDATDSDHRVVHVRETIPVPVGSAEMVLLYPEWLPGTHAPEGPIDRFAGLTIKAGGKPLAWTRDVANVFAFHVPVSKGVTDLDVAFDYLSPVAEKVGPIEITSAITTLEWNALVLYPAGYYARQIPVDATLTLPTGYKFGSALDVADTAGAVTRFKRTPLETLVDSPIYAGRYFARLDLDPGGPAPVQVNIVADKASELEVKPEQLAAHRALIQQAYRLYGSHHYDHYDFLLSISDLAQQQGLEHHRSSEDGVGLGYFADWDKALADRTLLPHEYTHSWNGKFRRPADLWTPNYNVKMRDSLLWVYEGQTEYWGEVLSARSGLRTAEQEREALALTIATYADVPGRAWRAVQDTTNDEIINPRRPNSWRSWTRFEDYYDEGALIWLDADTLIREKTNNAKSLDDFAKGFFGIQNGSYTPVTYTFEDVVAGLNAVMPYDWTTFLRTRLDAVGKAAPLDGVKRGGYRLVFTDKENEALKSGEAANKFKDFTDSLGFVVGKGGVLMGVKWGGPAFKAGLTAGMTIMAVDGLPYDGDGLVDALKEGKTSKAPLELIVKTADRFKVVRIDYHGGPRYPHLERIAGTPARLDDILAAKK